MKVLRTEFCSWRYDHVRHLPHDADKLVERNLQLRDRNKQIASALRRLCGYVGRLADHFKDRVPDLHVLLYTVFHEALRLIEPGQEYRLIISGAPERHNSLELFHPLDHRFRAESRPQTVAA